MKVVPCNQRNGGHRKARSPAGSRSVSAGLSRRSCGQFPDCGPFWFLGSRAKEILTVLLPVWWTCPSGPAARRGVGSYSRVVTARPHSPPISGFESSLPQPGQSGPWEGQGLF